MKERQGDTHQPRPRAPLTRDRVLRAAIGLVDDGGIESLSMRTLGRALGVEAMSLYKHVANKDDLLDGILDLVLAETEDPSPDDEWVVATRRSAMSVHRALRRHTWAATLLMSPNHTRPARLRSMDALLGRLRAAGFPADATYHAYHVLDAYVFGYAVWHTGHSYSDEEVAQLIAKFSNTITPDEYPYVSEHVQQHMSDGPHQETSAFEYGLELILDGLRRVLEPE